MKQKMYVYVAAPDGQIGGGMGRVKDNIVKAQRLPWWPFEVRQLVTRDARGTYSSLMLTLRAICAVWKAKLSGQNFLVHVNFGDNGSAVRKGLIVLGARACGVPTILHLHAVQLERQYPALPSLIKLALRAVFRVSSCCVVLGPRAERWLHHELKVPKDRIEILWNGVETAAPAAERPSNPGPIEILFLGNLMPRKGVSELLSALGALRTEVPWRITFAGGGDLAGYTEEARRYRVLQHCCFTGWVGEQQAKDLISSADLLVLPSYEEGLPLSILEALSAGTAVICTPVGEIPEVLENDVSAVLAPAGDVAALTESLKSLIEDSSRRSRIAAGGRELYQAKFTLDAFHAALLRIYHKHGGTDVPGLNRSTAA